jgi:dethiobiotin synthetase
VCEGDKELNIIFTTGTDTGVGKTAVTALAVALLRFKGYKVAVTKPVETGCSPMKGGELRASDAELLRKAAGTDEQISDSELCPYRFAAPIAPEVAAYKEGGHIDAQVIVDIVSKLKERFDFVFVEGAGGLMVPLARDLLISDLAKEIGAPLLIVGRAGLGTINHCLLTVHAALTRSIGVAGVVLNTPINLRPNDDPSVEDNVRVISYYSGVPVWGPLPHDPAIASGKVLPWESTVLAAHVAPLVEAIERSVLT